MYRQNQAGIYEIEVKWGEKQIPGSPFSLIVGETFDGNGIKERTANGIKLKTYRSVHPRNIFVYYSARSKKSLDHHHKEQINKLLCKVCSFHRLFRIPIDVEMTRQQRKEIYNVVNTKQLPFVFANDKYIGNFNDVMSLHQKGELKDSVERAFEDVDIEKQVQT